VPLSLNAEAAVTGLLGEKAVMAASLLNASEGVRLRDALVTTPGQETRTEKRCHRRLSTASPALNLRDRGV
jgi:hypothetical protein